MNFLQKSFLHLQKEISAGGFDHVPPAGCPPSACPSACVPAHAERTGKAVTNKSDDMWTVSPVTGNGLILFSELRL